MSFNRKIVLIMIAGLLLSLGAGQEPDKPPELPAIKKENLVKCPQYFKNFVEDIPFLEIPIPKDGISTKEDEELVTCPSFPTNNYCCKDSFSLRDRFSSRYLRLILEISKISDHLKTIGLTLIDYAILLGHEGSTLRKLTRDWKSYRTEFATKNGLCLKSLFSHEASVSCLFCAADWAKKYIKVEKELKQGTLYLEPKVCSTVITNCTPFFIKIARLYSLILVLKYGMHSHLRGDEILKKWIYFGRNDLKLRTMIKTYQEISRCLTKKDCVRLCHMLMKPYGFNKGALVIESDQVKKVSAYLFNNVYKGKDLRRMLLESSQIFKSGKSSQKKGVIFEVMRILNGGLVGWFGVGEDVEVGTKFDGRRRSLFELESGYDQEDLISMRTRFSSEEADRLDTYSIGFAQKLDVGFVLRDINFSSILRFSVLLLILISISIF